MKTFKKIAFVFVLFASISCKKETTESNDLTIEDRVVNIVLDSSGNSNNKLIYQV